MIGTTSIQTVFKTLMKDSTIDVTVHQSKLGIQFYTFKKARTFKDYIKWMDRNREYLEAKFNGYLEAGGEEMNFDEFARSEFKKV